MTYHPKIGIPFTRRWEVYALDGGNKKGVIIAIAL